MRKKLFRTDFERLRAVYRNPNFLKEFEEMEALGASETPLRKKWKINGPILLSPELFKEYEQRHLKNPHPFFEDHPVTLASIANIRLKNKPVLTDKGWKIVDDEIDWSSLLKDEKYLELRIDLTARKGDVIKAIERYYGHYKQYVKKSEGRNSSTDIDPFEIYELHKKMNLLKRKWGQVLFRAAKG